MSYAVEKTVWTDDDFEGMGWHDATLWSMLADPEAFEFAFDLDYIFEWVHPGPGETYFKFHVAPVTLVFHSVHDVVIDIRSQSGSIEVADLHRGEGRLTPGGPGGQPYERAYRFECQEGDIRLWATGYSMYVRRAPLLLQRQRLELAERGGISFARGATAA